MILHAARASSVVSVVLICALALTAGAYQASLRVTPSSRGSPRSRVTPVPWGPQSTAPSLPSALLPCYENATLYARAMRLPSTMAALTGLVAKVERAGGLNMDMRTLTASLLHRFRVDGMQREPEVPRIPGIVPFTPSGRQFHKYKVLMDQLIPPGGLFPEDSLQEFEKCALHFMLSSSVQPWERGDEFEVCPLTLTNGPRNTRLKPQPWSEWPSPEEKEEPRRTDGHVISRCPIEEGALWTRWGDVSAGTLLAGIAASLQPQNVPLAMLMRPNSEEGGDPLSNIWAATLAGDLAEVAVYQGPRASTPEGLRMGPGGRWNDSAVTRVRYLDPWLGPVGGWEEESWDLTEAELRGGIDGFVLSTKLPTWLNSHKRLRLSQLLEMFYSERGVAMEPRVKACNRAQLAMMLIPENILKQQTMSFARVLYDHVSSVPIAPSALEIFAGRAVDSYLRFSETVMDHDAVQCPIVAQAPPRVEMLVVLDGSWTVWEAQRVISELERETDVSAHGSAIAVMDGWSGIPLVNFTRLSNYAVRNLLSATTWPVGLDLERTLRASRAFLLRRRALEERRGENVSAASRGTVILILAPTATNSFPALELAKKEMVYLRSSLPDVTTMFVTARRAEDYIDFTDEPKRDVIMVKDKEISSFLPAVVNRLKDVVGRLVPAMCPELVQSALLPIKEEPWVPSIPRAPHFEDYVTPEEARVYRVPSTVLLGAEKLKFTLRNSDYGDLVACTSRVQPGVLREPPIFPNVAEDPEERCEPLSAGSEVRFTINQPCTISSSCRPVFLLLRVQRSAIKCMEDDCRFPNQVRFSLWHEGLLPPLGCRARFYNRTNTGATLPIPGLHTLLIALVVILVIDIYET